MSAVAVAERMSRGLERVGLDWLAPMVRLAAGVDPAEQLSKLARAIGFPLLGLGVFLLAWWYIAPKVQTPIGTLPGPAQVWNAAGDLVRQHKAERAKAAEYYSKLAERRAMWEKRFPGTPFVAHPYAGKPTYLDQIVTSLLTVFTGFALAAVVAVPVGILCGSSAGFYSAVGPFIQIFKPVSPLAWLPLVTLVVAAVYNPQEPMLEKAFIVSAVVVSLCSLWPTLINTAVGVASIDKDHMNVARVLQLSPWQRVRKIIIPSALPYIFTGLRLSLGVGWMVLIAAEMLAQNPGLGKFVWDMFQNGSSETLAMIFVAVFTIGIIGFVLDRIMVALEQLVRYDTAR